MNLGIIGKNFLITGGNGMLATDISKHLRSFGYNVIDDFFDITVPFLWEQILNTNKIDFIVHAAAITDVDYCELNANECYRVNYEFIKKVIPLLKEEKFIYFSSTGVYGNSKNTIFNNEDDPTLPSTKYHLSKLKTENYLKFNYESHLILRLGWLYGGNVKHKKNFVHKILNEAIQKEIIYSDDDILGSPTSTLDVSKQLNFLIEKNITGIFNCVNTSDNPISRLEYVRYILNTLNLKNSLIPAPINHFKRLANIPKNESALNLNLNKLKFNIMNNWEASLSKYILENYE